MCRVCTRTRTLKIKAQPFDKEGATSLQPPFTPEILSFDCVAIFRASINCRGAVLNESKIWG